MKPGVVFSGAVVPGSVCEWGKAHYAHPEQDFLGPRVLIIFALNPLKRAQGQHRQRDKREDEHDREDDICG